MLCQAATVAKAARWQKIWEESISQSSLKSKVEMEVKMFEIAKRYIEHGFSTIPLKPRSKEPCVSWKEYQSRLPSKDELNKWRVFWEKGGNLGVICGKVSGNLVVIDLDSPRMFNNFSTEYPELTKTWITRTGKGFHIWLRCKDTRSYGMVRGEGLYIVVPPSIHPSGVKYVFLSDSKQNGLLHVDILPDLSLIRLPKNIRTLITTGNRKYRSRSEADMAAICGMVRFGYTDEEIIDVFSKFKIGEKYRERGRSGNKYLSYSIAKARSFIAAKDKDMPLLT